MELLKELLAINESSEVYESQLKGDYRKVVVTDNSLIGAIEKYGYDCDGYFQFLKDIYKLQHKKDFITQSTGTTTTFYIYETSIKRMGNLFDKFVNDMNGVVSESYIVQLKGTEPDDYDPSMNLLRLKPDKTDAPKDDKSKKDVEKPKSSEEPTNKGTDAKESTKLARKKSKTTIKKESTSATSIPSKVGTKTIDKLDTK